MESIDVLGPESTQNLDPQQSELSTNYYDDDSKRTMLSSWLASCRTVVNPIPDYVYVDRRGHAYVRVRVHTLSLYNIDTVNQSFGAKVRIQLKWTVRKLFSEINVESQADNEWKPTFEVMNNIDKIMIKVSKLEKVGRGIYTDMYYDTTIQGTFSEHFEVHQFPMDRESLHVKVVFTGCPISIKRQYRGELTEIFFPKRATLYQIPGKSVVYKESFVQPDVWELSDGIVLKHGRTLSERNDDGVRFLTLDINMNVTRKIGFYVLNVIIPVFLLVNLSFASFFIDAMELTDRLTVTLTILLTLVALKYVIVQYLPTTSYVTYLDKYVLCSFIYVTLVALQNVIMYWLLTGVLESNSKIDDISDMNTGYVLFGTWNLMHCGLCVLLKENIRKKLIYSAEKELEGDEVETIVRQRHSRSSPVVRSDSSMYY
jgi:hypothetical protein